MPLIRLTIFLFFLSFLGFGQSFTIPDSLQHKTFDEVEQQFYAFLDDSIRKTTYAQVLLAKAKAIKEPLALAKSYRYVSFNYRNDIPKRVAYLDSSIAIGKVIKTNDYPGISYSNLALIYFHQVNYNKALDNYLLALEHATSLDNQKLYYVTKHNIALIKTKIDENKDAIKIFKEVLAYKKGKSFTDRSKLLTYLTLANAYRKTGVLDSASLYNAKGYQLAKRKESDMHHFFTLSQGINLFYQEQYNASLDSILKGMPYAVNKSEFDREFLVSGYLHLGKLYTKLNDNEISLKYLQKIDQLHDSINFTSIETRHGYEELIDYYKKGDDKNKQLYYINKLFRVDSILDTNYKNLSKKIVTAYDTPTLIAEKQQLINDLKKREERTSLKLTIAIIVTLMIIIFFIFIYAKNLIYKKRFRELMNTQQQTIKKQFRYKNTSTPESIGIAQNIVNEILTKLTNFEKKQGFLSPNITTNILAKQLQTNTKYLSKVINAYKQKSSRLYINELRIEYVIKKLQNDPKFRLYSIKAIAHDCGFNTSEVFSKSFYKQTGIYPSYFIKQLAKKYIK